MLETLARWIAWRCAVRRIPIVLLTDADLKAGKAGICDHDAVSNVYKKSDHWDVGENFPWDVVIPRAKQIAGVGGTTPPAATYHVVVKGDTLTKIAAKYKTSVAALTAANGIKDASKIFPGQRIKIVGAGSSPTPSKPKPPPPKTGVRGRFPYPSDHYFYTTTADRRCHSGYGTEGADDTYIRWIQQEVGVTQDGEYGPDTKAAVYRWQGRVGLSRDGVFGPMSWARAAAS
jgi:peptidoglycan hydrolase-like protein with peptidoglycan-binding domain